MQARDIPDFIFRGATLSVDGVERTLKDFSLQVPAPPSGEPRKGFSKKVLVLEFREIGLLEYDPQRVRDIPGRMPDFIAPGKKIFCRDPVKPGENIVRALNGEWEIMNAHFEKENGKPKGLRLVLKRGHGTSELVISRLFNARAMTPPPEQDMTPLIELQADLEIKKPYVLKRKL